MITQRMMLSSGNKSKTEMWQFTVNTEATTQGAKTTGIPFNLYNQDGVTLIVDWGDGSISRLSSADYTFNDSTASVHEYAQAGIYTISISSKQFSECYLLNINHSASISTINNAVAPLYWYKRTLISVNNILPKIAGKNYYASPTNVSSLTKSSNNFSYLFCDCNNCTTIPFGLFDNNTTITDLSWCFYKCSSLTAIPSGLFDNNTAVTTFYNCFVNCTSLIEIPVGLFDHNTEVTTFSYCFNTCSSLTTIPIGLFNNNTNVTTFSYCFNNC